LTFCRFIFEWTSGFRFLTSLPINLLQEKVEREDSTANKVATLNKGILSKVILSRAIPSKGILSKGTSSILNSSSLFMFSNSLKIAEWDAVELVLPLYACVVQLRSVLLVASINEFILVEACLKV
jgi:hypothetical protein